MRTKIFAYKGYVGILSGPDAEHMVAKPGNGNLGCVFKAQGVDVSPEALTLLKSVGRGSGGLGEVDIFQAGDKVIIGWLGGYLKAFKPSEIEMSRDYNPGLLSSTEGVEVPEEFKKFIDGIIEQQTPTPNENE